jgi:hypothetical protein
MINAVLISNGIVFFDLYLILRNPFKERSSRLIVYYFIIIVSIIALVITGKTVGLSYNPEKRWFFG